VLAGAALFVIKLAGRSLGQVGDTFDRLHWHWLMFAVVAEAGSVVALSWLQQRLLRLGDLPVGVRQLLPVTMASNAVAQSLPGGTLVAEGYALRQYRRLGAGWTLGLWAELSAGALAAAGLAAVAVAGAVVAGPGLRLELLPGLAVILAGALVAAGLFRRAPLIGRLITGVLRWAEHVLPESICGHLRSAAQSTRQMDAFRPSARTWALCFGAAVLNWALDAVVLLMALLAVGGPVPWSGVLVCYAAAQLLVELPITPGGLGVVEGSLVELLTRFHMEVARATAAMLLYRSVSYWLLVLVGWGAALALALRNRRADRLAAGGTGLLGAAPGAS